MRATVVKLMNPVLATDIVVSLVALIVTGFDGKCKFICYPQISNSKNVSLDKKPRGMK